MGLTIHYAFQCEAATPDDAGRRVHELQRNALDLRFDDVGDVREFEGDDIISGQNDGDMSARWLLIQAGNFLEVDGHYYDVTPTHVIAFSTSPGPGSETANFGLCRFPETITVGGRELPTELSGWCWSSFCKTQYASNKEYGGVENFLRCHRTIVQLLDRAKEMGILDWVSDESGYWQDRDAAGLAQTVHDWNRKIAGFVGSMKDQTSADIEAEITAFPDFEHLEAEGRDERGDSG